MLALLEDNPNWIHLIGYVLEKYSVDEKSRAYKREPKVNYL